MTVMSGGDDGGLELVVLEVPMVLGNQQMLLKLQYFWNDGRIELLSRDSWPLNLLKT